KGREDCHRWYLWRGQVYIDDTARWIRYTNLRRNHLIRA
ncbi:ABC transporter, ATP-binding protein, partial [Vibrio harveyi]